MRPPFAGFAAPAALLVAGVAFLLITGAGSAVSGAVPSPTPGPPVVVVTGGGR
ncbi:hypothetical protein [Sphaerisporangium album]|uniref:hypothetical protein n=1 Tax=Sphaerisporangium album TaxID=509200 RepID=UPI0015F0C27D|nr:hypothetical protein [Sphaerisporangium album]